MLKVYFDAAYLLTIYKRENGYPPFDLYPFRISLSTNFLYTYVLLRNITYPKKFAHKITDFITTVMTSEISEHSSKPDILSLSMLTVPEL